MPKTRYELHRAVYLSPEKAIKQAEKTLVEFAEHPMHSVLDSRYGQWQILFFDENEVPTGERRIAYLDPDRPGSPYSNYVGNRNALKRLIREDFAALAKHNHQTTKNFAVLGPASTGKTHLVRLRAKALGLPLVEISPKAVKEDNDILVAIAQVLADTKVTGTNIDLRLVPGKMAGEIFVPCEDAFVLPPMIVFIDEVHALSNKVVQALLKATEPNDRMWETSAGWMVDCRNVCWMIATTDRGLLFDAFDTRFSKIYLSLYTKDELAKIIRMKYDFVPDRACELIVKFGGTIPREVLMFAEDVIAQRDMFGESWENAVESVRIEHGIDEHGMTERRVKILQALAKGPVARNRMTIVASCKEEELVRFVMPALLESTPDMPACVAVGTRGYELTEQGILEAEKRGFNVSESVRLEAA